MAENISFIVALEDLSSASVVAAGAAHLAMEADAAHLVLVHVLDDHTVSNGLGGLAGVPMPVIEASDHGELVFALAEAALRGEYTAKERPVPTITRELREGAPATAIARSAADAEAAAVIVGARRPHVFGRLTHPDVVAGIRRAVTCPVHVVPLQADTPGQGV